MSSARTPLESRSGLRVEGVVDFDQAFD